MEPVDFNKDRLACRSNVTVSVILKIEIIIAVLFFFETDLRVAVAIGAVCAVINQITEMAYTKKQHAKERLYVLLISLFVTVLFYLAAWSIHAQFLHHWHGISKIDGLNIWLLAKLCALISVLLGAARLLAFGSDWLLNKRAIRPSH